MIYNIYNVFDANPSLEARGAFLDLWKAFDRVWHKDLTYKLKCLGICEIFFRLIHSFLIDRRQKLVLHGQSSILSHVEAGFPQGSIIRPLLFLVYIHDLSGLTSVSNYLQTILSLFSVVSDPKTTSASLNEDLTDIYQRASQWKMLLHPDILKQAQEIVFSRKKSITNHETIYFNNMLIVSQGVQKHLDLFLDVNETFLKYD